MPALERPLLLPHVELAPRTARLAAETDVLVVGGGPAGIGAAMGAAQAGAEVILVERYGFFGGNATASLVMPLMSFHTQRPHAEKPGSATLLPGDHGPGDPVLAGVVGDFIARLVAAGGAVSPSLKTGYVVPFDPETFKIVAMEMLDQAGVKFLFHSLASEVIGNGTLDGVVFETKSGPLVIRAKIVIDCTGDGDVAARAGVPFDVGREDDGLVQPVTLMFRMVEFERQAFEAYAREHPDQWRGVHGLWDLIRHAKETGELDLPREEALFFATPHEREISVNMTRVPRTLGTDVWDLSYAEWECRRQLRQIVTFFRRYVPGFESAYVAQTGSIVGVRETRRFRGAYQLTADDVLEARKFDDVIARSTYPVDIHNPTGPGTVLKRLPPGESYDIPLRCLIPQQIDNLLIAGRCLSATHEALSSCRVMPVSMATGQAAGVCGALAARRAVAPAKVPVKQVQEELTRQGASLGRRPAAAGKKTASASKAD
ncbi:MAG: FAD-dependent oxidoreductase [Thiogranum sp.]|nr:FAD-dependent oxidoreductase [Thiogranum sp.]